MWNHCGDECKRTSQREEEEEEEEEIEEEKDAAKVSSKASAFMDDRSANNEKTYLFYLRRLPCIHSSGVNEWSLACNADASSCAVLKSNLKLEWRAQARIMRSTAVKVKYRTAWDMKICTK